MASVLLPAAAHGLRAGSNTEAITAFAPGVGLAVPLPV